MLISRFAPPTSVTEPTPRTFSSRFFSTWSDQFVNSTPDGILAPPTPCCAGLPPEGAFAPWGGPAVVRPPPTPCCAGLPPEGAFAPWGGPAGVRPPPTPCCAGLPPKGAFAP